MHISKIIDYVKNEIRFSQEFCEDNVFVTLRIEPISKIIENLEQSHKDVLELTKEIEQKDKQIDLMAEYISKRDVEEDICMKNRINADLCNEDYTNCKNCIKQYFERKVEEC